MGCTIRTGMTALRALESASRRRSFTLAAEELHVTHSAISHQIKQLEGLLNKPLFVRSGTEMMPTAICLQLASRVRSGLAEIDAALTEAAQDHPGISRVLTVSVMADFANVWLLPRLQEFSQRHPDIQLSIKVHNELEPPDFHALDVGIWHRRVEQSGFRSSRLPEDWVIAACTPDFMQRHGVKGATDLGRVPLLRFASRSWDEYFHAAGIDMEMPKHGATLSDAASLLNAALAGQGVAMLRERLVRTFLERAELVRVGDVRIPSNMDYYICWEEGSPQDVAIQQFSNWLHESIR